MTEPGEYVQHFHSSINEFPVKTTEDQQNERLRKIHTFQASFDDFVSYVNQRIEDTKSGKLPQKAKVEKNNLVKEGTLPMFDEFISEGYQEFIDDETGEIVTMWVEDPDPEEEKKKLEKAKEDSKKYEAACKKEREYITKLNPLENELWGYEDELKRCNAEYRQLKIDMEEEIGNLYAQEKFAEGDELGQSYGVSMDRLEKQIKGIKRKMNSVQVKISNLRKAYENIWDF